VLGLGFEDVIGGMLDTIGGADGGIGRGRRLIIEGPAMSSGRRDGKGVDGWKEVNELDAGQNQLFTTHKNTLSTDLYYHC